VDTPVIITWNFTNWVTVVLMALVGYMIFGLVTNGLVRVAQKKAS
jgi:hypothetical protein